MTYARGLCAAFALLAGAVSLVRGLEFSFDFHHFYLDAEYVWRHAALNPDLDNADRMLRRQLPFYLPAIPIALAPLAALGRAGAAVIWALGQAAACWCCMRELHRWCVEQAVTSDTRSRSAASDRAWRRFVLVAVLSAPATYEAVRFNQLSLLVLMLALAAHRALRNGSEIRAACLVAVAAVVKLLPALLLVWLATRRRWRALLAAVATTPIAAIIPCLAVLGVSGTIEAHQQWLDYNLTAARGMLDPALREHFLDHRNQSLPDVLARLTDPAHPYRTAWQPMALSPKARGGIVNVARMLIVLLTIAATWPRAATDRQHSARSLAMWLLAMLLLAPLMRQYYLVWALPALAVFASDRRLFARIGIAVWTIGMLAWLSADARAYGAHWLMVLVMSAMLAALSLRAARRPEREAGQTPASPNTTCG
ncbi:MAG: glycosyltransferase 87 family protein [Phycisphaerae bacterium]